MNLHVLDTDHVTLFQRGHQNVMAKVLQASPDSLAVCIITVEEQLRGRLSLIRRAEHGGALPEAYGRLSEAIRFFAKLRLLDYSDAADVRYQALRRERVRIGTHDLRIASIVLSTSATLVTRNRRDFGQVPDLSIDDWSVT